jgi:MoaA/NifB/PqqE/SkfB family radical SAM enzyme
MFSITWMLGSRCNYDCMYCRPELHDTTSQPLGIEVLKESWQKIHEKTQHNNLFYKISFTGGEVTANKNFLPFVKWIRSEYSDVSMILITTNGSASLNYYQKLTNYVEAISFSTHSEYMNEQEFFHKVEKINDIMIRPTKSVHVNIMDEFWNKDRISKYQNRLSAKGISHSVNQIDYMHQTRTFPILKGNLNLE